MLMLWNAHQGTTHTPKNYVDQVLNGAINHYNSTLSTAYNRIATLEAEVEKGHLYFHPWTAWQHSGTILACLTSNI